VGSKCISPVWSGLVCNAGGSIISLSLSGLSLTGSLPQSIMELSSLTSLNLASNLLDGINSFFFNDCLTELSESWIK